MYEVDRSECLPDFPKETTFLNITFFNLLPHNAKTLSQITSKRVKFHKLLLQPHTV